MKKKTKTKNQLIKEVRKLSVAKHTWKELRRLKIYDLLDIIKFKNEIKKTK